MPLYLLNLTYSYYSILKILKLGKFILEPRIYAIIYICFFVQTVNAPTPSGAKLVPASHSHTSLLLLLCSNSERLPPFWGDEWQNKRPTTSMPPLE